MSQAYSKDFLIDCYLFRLRLLGTPRETEFRRMSEAQYEQQGKTVWRSYASITPEIIKQFQAWLNT